MRSVARVPWLAAVCTRLLQEVYLHYWPQIIPSFACYRNSALGGSWKCEVSKTFFHCSLIFPFWIIFNFCVWRGVDFKDNYLDQYQYDDDDDYSEGNGLIISAEAVVNGYPDQQPPLLRPSNINKNRKWVIFQIQLLHITHVPLVRLYFLIRTLKALQTKAWITISKTVIHISLKKLIMQQPKRGFSLYYVANTMWQVISCFPYSRFENEFNTESPVPEDALYGEIDLSDTDLGNTPGVSSILLHV